MTRVQAVRPLALAVAAVFALGAAVTAFGVAPLPEAQLPAPLMVREAIEFRYEVAAPVEGVVQSDRVRRGDTVASLIGRLGATDPAFTRFIASDPVARRLLQFQAGRIVHAEIDSVGRVQRFHYPLGAVDSSIDPYGAQRLTVHRTAADTFQAREERIALVRTVQMHNLEITSSLFAATDGAGIPDSIASQVADILGGEVDFQRDLRKGDRLRISYETLQEADSLAAPSAGRVLAVELSNNGRVFEAIRFDHADDGKGEYFSADGKSLKKSFLRYPIEFARISSGFTESRRHPVFGDKRPHRGVDFAAPTGTRVRATGDGTVEYIGRQNGYGNVIKVQHNNRLETLYGHLSGFVANLRSGTKVRQGDVIGYVGQTGWATGPHLHYEFQVNGAHTDPLRVALPPSRPLDAATLARFTEIAATAKAQLAQLEIVKVARFE